MFVQCYISSRVINTYSENLTMKIEIIEHITNFDVP